MKEVDEAMAIGRGGGIRTSSLLELYFFLVFVQPGKILTHTHSFMFLPPLVSDHSEPPPSDERAPEGDAPPGGLTDADLESNWNESIETFDAMGLPEELLRGIYSYGFEKPSAIQQRAIQPAIMGHDLIAQAQSGTVRNFDRDLELAL